MNDSPEKLISHYRIIEKLGEGGMGVVYSAVDERLDRRVALKFLPPLSDSEAEKKRRFVVEAKAASALDHPNICTIHEIDETPDGRLFIVMACYEGETLRQKMIRLAESGSAKGLPISEAFDIAFQIMAGLAKSHQKAIVHRDIKPANIMITREGAVKLLDFGLAKIKGTDITHSQAALGTIAYASPEQLRGEASDHRGDIWSTGVILYEMLSGKNPFAGETVQSTFYSILNEPPLPLAELRPELPAELDAIVEKALDKDPGERYASMTAFQEALKFFTETHSAEEQNAEVPRPVSRSFQLRWGVLAVVILLAGLVAWQNFSFTPSSLDPPLRLAVLPFDNISPDQQYEYIAEGMTEELISRISQIQELQVIAKASSDRFRSHPHDLAEIARTLDVSTIITGSVRTADQQLRIGVQLIDLKKQTNLWSHTYDRRLTDIFAIQTDIAQQVTQVLQIQLHNHERQKLHKISTANLTAYHYYLKGRFSWNKRTPESLKNALDFFQKAVREDTAFALAYAGIADALALFGSTEYGVAPAIQIMPQAKQAALKAVTLDPELAEAHTALGNIHLFYDWDWQLAEREFQRALELDPNYATAHHWYAIFLMISGQRDKSYRRIRQALALDPVSLIINTEVGWLRRYGRDYEQALQQLRETLRFDPNFVITWLNLGFTQAARGEFESAVVAFRKAQSLSGSSPPPMIIGSLGYALASAGYESKARQELKRLKDLAAEGYIHPLYFALIYIGLGDSDRVMEYLEKAYRERAGYLIYLGIDPLADPMQDDPRFVKFLQKIGPVSDAAP